MELIYSPPRLLLQPLQVFPDWHPVLQAAEVELSPGEAQQRPRQGMEKFARVVRNASAWSEAHSFFA